MWKEKDSVAVWRIGLGDVWATSVVDRFLGRDLRKLGKAEDADALYAELIARARRQYVSPVVLSLATAAAARESEAIHHACDAFEIRDPECQMLFSPHLAYSAPLYAYPRFCQLLAQHGRSDWLRD